MRLKLKESILGASLILLVFLLYGCIEEPTIEPVKRATTQIRVVNLSDNVNNMSFTVYDKDDITVVASGSGLSIASASQYIDIPAGKRRFIIKDEAGQEVYNEQIEIISWERTSVCFAGYYSLTDLENTFSHFALEEGLTYIDHSPGADTAYTYLVNGAADIDTTSAQKYTIDAVGPDGEGGTDSVSVVNDLGFGQMASQITIPGDYKFYITYTANESDSTIVYTTSIEEGYKYYLFLYGNPLNVDVFENKLVPQPPISRD